MRGKVFWGLVILLFIGILVIPFVLPSYYASQAEAQYNNEQYSENFVGEEDEEESYDGFDIDLKKRRKKTSTGSTFAKSVRSSGGSRSYRSGK
ncbi:hypothetical protein H206_00897 [Candidatus Electrothrix aarhusensis]|uniref:Uncharacterized protein n=1 Tax=Candidatus Electrothrix aarhusensis TaxID=1859131 RepID=A0A3S4T8R2_9BACT|nr:hypothetical protein H206_00897 [Candidatus Electrothrix aarhusensis]